MALSFYSYVGIHVACGLVFLTVSILLLVLCYYRVSSVYIFFNERIFGITLTPNSDTEKTKTDRFLVAIANKPVKGRCGCGNNCCLIFVGGFTLAMALMVLFEGCVLASASIKNGDQCPDDPVTCFVFDNTSHSGPVSDFECVPGNTSIVSSNATGVWCYGWIVRRNTVSRVINQIGICGGIIGVFGTLFAFMYQAHAAVAIIILILAILMVIVMVILSTLQIVSFSILAYVVCANCIIIGLTGSLFNIIAHVETESPVQITVASANSKKMTPVKT